MLVAVATNKYKYVQYTLENVAMLILFSIGFVIYS